MILKQPMRHSHTMEVVCRSVLALEDQDCLMDSNWIPRRNEQKSMGKSNSRLGPRGMDLAGCYQHRVQHGGNSAGLLSQ